MNISTEMTVSFDQEERYALYHHFPEQKMVWQRSPPQRSQGVVPLCRVFVTGLIDSSRCNSTIKTMNDGGKEFSKNKNMKNVNEQKRCIPSRECRDISLCPVYVNTTTMDALRCERRVCQMKMDSPPRYPKRKIYPTEEPFSSLIFDPPLNKLEESSQQQQQEDRQRNHTTHPREHTTDCLIGLEISFHNLSAHENDF
jgi:hypothetical protein